MTGYQSKRAAAQDKLAQPAQEPMQYNCTVIDDTHPNGIPLSQWGQQAPQRPWVDLTDEDIALIDWESLVTKKDCVRTIEARLKDKNT